MYIYIALYLFLIVYSLLGYDLNKTIHKNVYWFVIVLLILFAACRGNGYDWDSYYEIFRGVHNGVKREGAKFVEYGFQLLCYICPNYRSLVVLTAVLSVGMTLSATYRLTEYGHLPLLGLIVFYTTFFFGSHMGQTRQALAGGFVMWSIVCALNHQRKQAILLVIAAAFFHISALLALIVPFIPQKKFPIGYYIIAIIVAFAVSSQFIAPLLGRFITGSSSGISDKLVVYAFTEKAVGVTSTILIRIATLVLALSFNQDKAEKDNKIAFLCNIYFYGILIYGLFNFLPQLGGRGSSYFSAMEIILVPYLVYRLWKYKPVYFLGYLLILALSTYRFISFFSDAHNFKSFVPYFG